MMRTSHKWIILTLSFAAILVGACAPVTDLKDQQTSAVSLTLVEPTAAPDFARAVDVQEFSFPQDHGPHFEYQTEWWYYTGNLQTEDGQRFGYQFTIFRRALAPGEPPEGDGLATNQIYFAHVALTDVAGESHFFDERFSRGAADLAGAQADPFAAWVEDWRVESEGIEADQVLIVAEGQDFELDLTLEAIKPIVRHGQDGLSAKSDEVGNASYYLSFTRIQTVGDLRIGDRTYEVSGLSWFDHEWSTSVLDENAVGWDWFGLQLDDGRELMLYFIRLADGEIDPISGGTFIGKQGEVIGLEASEVQIEALDTWLSEQSGTEYPSGWRINLPALDMELTVEPLIEAQEMRVSFTYWEGAVRIRGEQDGVPFGGSGYVELTGYLESMEGVLS